jgi:hypothetical protein
MGWRSSGAKSERLDRTASRRRLERDCRRRPVRRAGLGTGSPLSAVDNALRARKASAGIIHGDEIDAGSEGPMTVTIDLPPELLDLLRQQAARAGQDVSAFVVQAVQERIARARSFDEVCAPFARAVEASGMTDAELEGFFEEVREEVWQEKQSKPS